MEVRNLSLEVEREVQPQPVRADDENEPSGDNRSSNEEHEYTDPDAEEVPNDEKFTPNV